MNLTQRQGKMRCEVFSLLLNIMLRAILVKLYVCMNFFKNSCVKHNQTLLGTLLSDLYFDTKYSYMYVQEISSLLHQ